MKLYYATGACSLSPHIALREAGIPFDLVKVDLRAKRTEAGDDFKAINPRGYVPVLELTDGRRLTEGPAIVQYIADSAPQHELAPAAGSFDRYRLQEWLNLISTELHKQYSPLFDPAADDAVKARQRERIGTRLDWIQADLGPRDYLMGKFTVADAYLYTVLRWSRLVGIDLARWPALVAYQARVEARPAVQAALRAEGMLKD